MKLYLTRLYVMGEATLIGGPYLSDAVSDMMGPARALKAYLLGGNLHMRRAVRIQIERSTRRFTQGGV